MKIKIGLTYDLRQDYLDLGFDLLETAEFDRNDTIDAIESTLQELGYATERIGNIWNLTKALAEGQRWDLVFNISEGLIGYGRESQIPALLDAYAILYTFSDPLVLNICLHKGICKRILRDQQVPTPPFAEIHALSDLNELKLDFPLFTKPMAEGTGKGIDARSKIKNKDELRVVCHELLEEYQQPVLVEEFLPGREFTVGILGSGQQARAIGTVEIILKDKAEAEVYSYVNKENCEDLVIYQLATDDIVPLVEEVALNAWRAVGALDAGRIDLRLDKNGIPNVMEINPLAGLHPEHSDLPIIAQKVGIPYKKLIGEIVESAWQRAQEQAAHHSIRSRVREVLIQNQIAFKPE